MTDDPVTWQPPTLATVVAVDDAILRVATRIEDETPVDDVAAFAMAVWNLAAARENLSARPYPKGGKT